MFSAANAAAEQALAREQDEAKISKEEDTENDEESQKIKERMKMFRDATALDTFPLQRDPVGYAWSKAVANDMLLKED